MQKNKLLPGAEVFPRQQFMNPCPGHQASVAVWHTVAEAVLQQVLQLVSWKTNVSKTFNVNMPIFNCLETYLHLTAAPPEHVSGLSTPLLESRCPTHDLHKLV